MPIHDQKIGVLGDSNETHAPIANPPNSAQLGAASTTPPSNIRVRGVVSMCGRGQTYTQTDTQTRVTTIHFASSTTHAKCSNKHLSQLAPHYGVKQLEYTLCLNKNVQHLVCYNFDTRERILIFFGRNVTDKVCEFHTTKAHTNRSLLHYWTTTTATSLRAFINKPTKRSIM